jgi:hypothetical protein
LIQNLIAIQSEKLTYRTLVWRPEQNTLTMNAEMLRFIHNNFTAKRKIVSVCRQVKPALGCASSKVIPTLKSFVAMPVLGRVF